MEGFKGIFTAVLTPFDYEGKINEKALERLLEMNIKKGVTGFYVGGSTAEAFLMSADERKKLLELTVQIVNGRAKIISHIGCISTDAAIDLARHAEAHGADIISSVAPFYYKFSFEEIKSYYYDIVNSVSKPMLIYNFPSFSGVTLGVEEVAQFLEDDRFVGVKHTSNNFFDLERFKAAYPDKLFYNGFDEMFLSGMAMGADGGVGSTYNFMAEKFVKMYKLCGEGKFAEAKKIQAEANRIIKILIKVGVFAGEKAVLELMGIEMGGCRRPFKSAVTAAQSIKHTLPDFDKAEFVGKYKINDFVSRGINIGILSKTRRAAVSVYPDRLALRTYNYKESKVDFMNVANVATEKGKWYTLKIVMELYDAATSDYRYSVYRKADGEEGYTCIARNLPTDETSRANNIVDLYVENDATIDCLVDDVSITTWSSQTTGVQKVSKNLTADGTYTAEYKVRLNRDIATNGANVAVYNGGYRSFMRVQPERFTVIGGDGKARAYPIAHEIGKWYTYIVSVKDFKTQSIYRRVEDETEFTLVADAIGMQPQKSSRNRIELFIEGNGNQSIDVDYVREYKGLAVDVRELGATTVAELLNGTDAAVGVDAVAAAYDGNTLVGAAISGRQLAAHSSESISLTAGAGESYKLLLWDSANKLAPIDFAR